MTGENPAQGSESGPWRTALLHEQSRMSYRDKISEERSVAGGMERKRDRERERKEKERQTLCIFALVTIFSCAYVLDYSINSILCFKV